MKITTEIIAVNIKNDELISVKTTDNPSISFSELLGDISSSPSEYFIKLNNKKYLFKVNENGNIIIPKMAILKQCDSY